MENITVDSLQQKINSIADLIQLQSKQFDERLEKERAERERAYEKERTEREKFNGDFMNQLRKLNGLWSTFVENLIEPGIIELFEKYGVHLEYIHKNVKYKDKNGNLFYEIDMLLTNDDYIVLVEIKTSLNANHVDEHLARLQKVIESPHKSFNWANKKIIGCVAGISVSGGADTYAIKNGLFVLVQSGSIVKLLNDNPFPFKVWETK